MKLGDLVRIKDNMSRSVCGSYNIDKIGIVIVCGTWSVDVHIFENGWRGRFAKEDIEVMSESR